MNVFGVRSLGIRNIRKINMSRGGREGNNAFTKDVSRYAWQIDDCEDVDTFIIKQNLPFKIVKEIKEQTSTFDEGDVATAFKSGNRDLASKILEITMKAAGIGKCHCFLIYCSLTSWLEFQDPASASFTWKLSRKRTTSLGIPRLER